MNTTDRPTLSNLLVVALAAGILSACVKKEATAMPEMPAAVVKTTNQPASAVIAEPDFEKLKGQWQRPDGGYILYIRSVDPSGKLDAAYFNPRPIHVEKADATQEGKSMKVFIELRDVNYPGSTYTLTYDPTNDRLTGIYYQATQRATYDVNFERLK